MSHVVIRSVPHLDAGVVAQFCGLGTATVHEAMGRVGSLGEDLRPNQWNTRIAGRAITVSSHPGDNLMIHAAVEMCGEGDILVVTTTAECSHGMFGELLASSLRARGVRGLVIDSGIRDTAELRAMEFPVWSRHVSVQGTVKASPGSVNVPVVFGRTPVHPGDLVCADDDGVVVVPTSRVDDTLAGSRERIAREEETRRRLAAGELGVDIYGLHDALAEAGVRYLDTADDCDPQWR